MGRGSVGRTVTSDTRGMSFESSLRQIFTTNILTVNYNKLARNGPFFKSLLETKATHFTFILSIFYLERYVCQRGLIGCGTVGPAVAPDGRNPWFESNCLPGKQKVTIGPYFKKLYPTKVGPICPRQTYF